MSPEIHPQVKWRLTNGPVGSLCHDYGVPFVTDLLDGTSRLILHLAIRRKVSGRR